jgi:hypothetical protein
MTDDFISSFRADDDFDDEPGEELPDWIGDTAEGADEYGDEEDSFDRLRQKSARTGAAYDEMDLDDNENEGLSLSHLSPQQRAILAVLLVLNVIVIVVGVLLITGL